MDAFCYMHVHKMASLIFSFNKTYNKVLSLGVLPTPHLHLLPLHLFIFSFLSSLFISSSLHLFPLNISSSSQAYLGSAVDSKFDVKTDLPGFVGCLRGLQLDSNPVSLSSLLAQNPGESELCFVFLNGLKLPNARMSQ